MEIATTWAEKRTMLRNISKVGTFVRKSMQELCHDEVLLALEARVQNCRGLASEMNITGTLPQAGNLKLFVPSLSTQGSTRPKQNMFNVVLMRPDKTERKRYFTTMQTSY